jgi:uncharacterized protein
MNNPLVIYHKNCADGLAAAWCFWRKYPHWEYAAAAYGSDPVHAYDRTVYLVDFSYPKEVIQQYIDNKCIVILLDHHKTAFEDLVDFKSPFFNMNYSTMENSGAVIAWNYTTEKEKRDLIPPVLKHIEDRDLWKFQLPHTKEIVAAVYAGDMTFERFDYLMNVDPWEYEDLKLQGSTIIKTHEDVMAQIIRVSSRLIEPTDELDPLWASIIFVNSPPMFASEIGSKLSEEYPMVAIYYDSVYGRRFSLRSKNGSPYDVSSLAQKYGGGGHIHAAGFSVSRDHPLAKV